MLIQNTFLFLDNELLHISTIKAYSSLLHYFLGGIKGNFVDFFEKVFFSLRKFVVFQSSHIAYEPH